MMNIAKSNMSLSDPQTTILTNTNPRQTITIDPKVCLPSGSKGWNQDSLLLMTQGLKRVGISSVCFIDDGAPTSLKLLCKDQDVASKAGRLFEESYHRVGTALKPLLELDHDHEDPDQVQKEVANHIYKDLLQSPLASEIHSKQSITRLHKREMVFPDPEWQPNCPWSASCLYEIKAGLEDLGLSSVVIRQRNSKMKHRTIVMASEDKLLLQQAARQLGMSYKAAFRGVPLCAKIGLPPNEMNKRFAQSLYQDLIASPLGRNATSPINHHTQLVLSKHLLPAGHIWYSNKKAFRPITDFIQSQGVLVTSVKPQRLASYAGASIFIESPNEDKLLLIKESFYEACLRVKDSTPPPQDDGVETKVPRIDSIERQQLKMAICYEIVKQMEACFTANILRLAGRHRLFYTRKVSFACPIASETGR